MLPPLRFALDAVYVRGLLLLDEHQTGTRIAAWLPGRAHDALNRLLTSHLLDHVDADSSLGFTLVWQSDPCLPFPRHGP